MLWKSYGINELVKIDSMYSLSTPIYEHGYNFAGETHNFWECVYVKRGSIEVSADDRILHLEAGQIVFHKPLELHKFYVDSPDGTELLIFSYDLVGDIQQSLADRAFTLDEKQSVFIKGIEECIDAQTDPNALYTRRYIELFEKVPNLSQKIVSYLKLLFLSLAENGCQSEQILSREAKLFRDAINYMNDSISVGISVNELAERLNISTSTLKRLFDKYAGMSVHKYFTAIKMNTATSLLSSGLSVGTVAERLGFSSSAYFSAVFKRETGKIPSAINKEI